MEFVQHHSGWRKRILILQSLTLCDNRFEGITWYLQKILNILFAMTPKGEVCGGEMIEQAVDFIWILIPLPILSCFINCRKSRKS